MKRSSFTLGLAGAALAAMLTHARSLSAPFFADDWLFLDQVRFRSLLEVLASPDPLGNFFRPLGRQVLRPREEVLTASDPFRARPAL